MESTICTPNQLKNLTSLSQNIDPELLNPHLLIAQQLYVQPILGDALYNDIVNRFNTNTLTGDSQTLYEEYIVAAIGFGAWYSIAPFLNYKSQRAGIQTTSSPDNTPVTVEELSLYISRVENLKNFYSQRLQTFLDNNQTKYPLYRQGDSQEVSKGGGLFLGFKSRRGYHNTECCDGWNN